MRTKITTKEFINNAELKHNYFYDYSISEYVGSNNKIKIKCPKHGDFEQIASSHLKGQGCKKCFLDNRRLTNDNLIKKYRLIHKNKYDYSLMKYNNIHNDVIIICPIHGDFKQSPSNHLKGRGCPNCGGSQRRTLVEFVEKSNIIHNNKYDYSLVNYINDKNKVKIICPIHGDFEQIPSSHLNGSGCKKCGDKSKQDYKRLSLSEFIERCNLKHSNKYDYSLIKQVELDNKHNIICNIHGVFKQKLKNHLYQGNGCPRCKDSKGEIEISKWLVNNEIKFIQQYRFPDCRDKLPLPFDFYLPDYNLCIEYDGEQHFKPIKRFGGIDKFLTVKKRDNIKTNYCNKNNINLLRIKFNENINNSLNLTTTISGDQLKAQIKSGQLPIK